MKNVVVIISHGHEDLLTSNHNLIDIAEYADVIIKDNVGSDTLLEFCNKNGIKYTSASKGLGFAANNNFAASQMDIEIEDNLFIINPDVNIDLKNFKAAESKLNDYPNAILGINLFKNDSLTDFDYSARSFPTLYTMTKSLFLGSNDDIIDKENVQSDLVVDWIAGSFLCMKARVFSRLDGFDENYFMYCEDIDLCFRAKLQGVPTILIPSVVALHHAQHQNRNIFSQHFLWHITSATRFFLKKNITKRKEFN